MTLLLLALGVVVGWVGWWVPLERGFIQFFCMTQYEPSEARLISLRFASFSLHRRGLLVPDLTNSDTNHDIIEIHFFHFLFLPNYIFSYSIFRKNKNKMIHAIQMIIFSFRPPCLSQLCMFSLRDITNGPMESLMMVIIAMARSMETYVFMPPVSIALICFWPVAINSCECDLIFQSHFFWNWSILCVGNFSMVKWWLVWRRGERRTEAWQGVHLYGISQRWIESLSPAAICFPVKPACSICAIFGGVLR